MKQVKETLIGFLIGMSCYVGIVEIIGLFFSGNILAYTLGLFLGSGVAVFLFFHMAKCLDIALDLPETQATKYMRRKSFFRLFIMLLALLMGLVVEKLNFIALVLGILGCKVGALLAPFFLKRLYPESYQTKISESTDME